MARWVNGNALRIDPVGYNDALQSAIGGYEFGQQVRDRRAQEELGSAMAAIPEAVTVDEYHPTAASNKLESEAKINTAGAIPTMGGENLRERAEAVGGMQRKTTTTSKDWKSWQDEIRKKAGAMGPEQLARANEHITTTMRGAMRDSAANAMAALQAGDLRTAKSALEEAYTGFPDGNRAEIDMEGDQLTAKVYDEESGKLIETRPITLQEVADVVRISEDPVAYADAIRQAELTAEAAREDRERFDITESRLSTKDSNDMTLGERRLKMQEGQAAIDAVRSGVQNKESEAKIKQIIGNMEELVKASKRADDMTEADINKIESSIEKAKADMEIDAAKLKLEQLEYIGSGAERNLKRQKIDAEIKELEAKATYYANGGTKAAGKTYFAKRNDLLQRMNTAANSMEAADEAMATEQKRAAYAAQKGDEYTINPTVQAAYDREQKRYKMITDMWNDLEAEYAPGGAIPTPESAGVTPPATPATPAAAPAAAPEPAGAPATPATAGPAVGQTATNPTTGDKVMWNGSSWVPQ